MKKVIILQCDNSLECHIMDVEKLLPKFGNTPLIASFDVSEIFLKCS